MDYLKFLSPISRKRTIQERLENYNRDEDLEQSGEGVVTRKQAKLLSTATDNNDDLSSAEVSKNKLTDNRNQKPQLTVKPNEDSNATDQFSQLPAEGENSKPSSPEPGHSRESPEPLKASDPLGAQFEEDNESPNAHLFSKETLVAENEDLQAYVIKSSFRRMKNFE